MTDMSGGQFMPHGYCFLWQPGVLWLHVLSDATIAFAYFCIPLALIYFVRKRKDMPFQRVFWLFGAFILLCGTTHVLSIWVLWHPNYYTEGVVKALTAIASVGTLIMTVRLMPQALSLPSPAQLAEANAKLQDANAKLEVMYEKSQEHGRVTLSAVVDNALDGIMTISEEGTVESFNAACLAMYGYERHEIIGKPIHLLVPESIHAEQQKRFRQMCAMPDADFASLGVRESIARRKDGSIFPVELSVSAFTIDGRRHFSAIIRDITKSKQAEDNRQGLLLRLTESNTELERFAYVASHDMQEPLRMVLNFSQIIAQDYKERLDEEGLEYLKIVGDSALRMRDMVQDLLDYARLGKEGLRYDRVDMGTELDHVTGNLSALIQETDATVTSDMLPDIHGNPVQMMRLLQNLIANAIKYQAPGNTPQIHVGVVEDDAHWQFSVRDNGMGIDEAFVEQVFEPFPPSA